MAEKKEGQGLHVHISVPYKYFNLALKIVIDAEAWTYAWMRQAQNYHF